MLTFAKSDDTVRVTHTRHDTLATTFVSRYSGIAHIVNSSSIGQRLAFGTEQTNHDPIECNKIYRFSVTYRCREYQQRHCLIKIHALNKLYEKVNKQKHRQTQKFVLPRDATFV